MSNPEQYVHAAQAVLAERVVACWPCTRTLGLSSLALSQVSGAAGAVQSARGRSRSGGLPQAFLAAVTEDDRLHLLSQPKLRWSPKPKATGVLASYDLATTRLAVSKAALGTRISLAADGGERPVEIQAVKGVAGDRLASALGALAAA